MLKNEIQGVSVSIIFDGTTHNGEALAIAMQFMRAWNVERLLWLLLARPVTGNHLAPRNPDSPFH